MDPNIDFQLLFESAPGMFIVLSPTPAFTILAVSDAYLEATKTEREKILGRGIFEVFPDDPNDPDTKAVEKARTSFNLVIQTGKPDRMGISKHSIRKPDGSQDEFIEKYWSPLNAPVFGKDGKIAYIIHRVEDVTEFIQLQQRESEISEAKKSLRTRTEQLEAEIYARAIEIQEANDRLKAANLKLQEREKELMLSEQRVRSIFDNSIDAILLTSPDGRIAMANNATTEIFGYKEEELRILGRAAMTDPSDPLLQAALEERRKKGRFRGELTFKCKDGKKIPAEVSSAIFIDEKGKEWTSMFIRDISERKKAEEEREQLLRRIDEKRRWIEAVVERAPIGILLVKGKSGETVTPNRWVKKFFGPDADWSKGRKAVLGIVSEAQTCIPYEFEKLATSRALQGETVTEEEETICRSDGTQLPVLINSGPIRDATGNIIGAVTTFQNISELKKAQKELEIISEEVSREKSWLQAVFNNSPIGMVMVRSEDPDHLILNLRAKKIFGPELNWNLAETSYLRHIRDTTGKVLSRKDFVTSRVLNGETILGEEQILCFKTGKELPVLVTGGPIKDQSGKQIGAVTFSQDISALKELERLREEWSAVIAHDLRQPITSIQLSAGLLKTLPCINGEITEMAEMIESSARQLNRMTHDLLEITQLEAKKLKLESKEIDIVKLLDQIVKKLSMVFSKNKINLKVSGQISTVHADPGRIEQIIGNLVSNAVKYGFPGTKIEIEVGQTGENIHVAIKNRGVGIEAKDLKNLFQRFHRTPHAKMKGIEGIGLGLYITKGLIEAHGGRIYAESIPAKLTTFHFELPVNGNKT